LIKQIILKLHQVTSLNDLALVSQAITFVLYPVVGKLMGDFP